MEIPQQNMREYVKIGMYVLKRIGQNMNHNDEIKDFLH